MNITLISTLALGALALPAAAQADTVKTTDYAVSIIGTADYNRADADTETAVQHDIAVDFQTRIPRFSFRDGVPEDSTGAIGTASVRRGSYVIQGTGASVRCASHAATDVTGGGLDATWSRERSSFATRVIGGFTVAIGACDVPMDWSIPFGSGGDPVGVGLWDGTFTMPASRVGEASMSFPLKGVVQGAGCPFTHALTVQCSLTWDAVVTFTKTGERTEAFDEDDLLVPLEPKPTSKAPQADPKAAASADDLVPVVAKARLAPNLARTTLPIACRKACAGTVTATAAGRTLDRRAFRAAAGRTAVAKLRFDAADRRAIRRAGKVRLEVRGRVGDRPVRRTLTVRR